MSRLPFPLHQLLLNNDLRRYARVIAAGEEESGELTHAVPAYERVLQCVREGMANMQVACYLQTLSRRDVAAGKRGVTYIWGWNRNNEYTRGERRAIGLETR